MKNQEIRIGLIGSQSMHAWAFAQACNEPDEKGSYRFPNARVVAVYGVDDTPGHIRVTMEKGNIPRAVASMEELFEQCDAFMILQRNGAEHMTFAEEIIRRGYPVFIDKPVCCSREDLQKLQELASERGAVICGGSGFKYNRQILRLKNRITTGDLGPVRDGAITYSADINSPYGGIFFYLPHAVEIMLELFGYEWRSVRVKVETHDHFVVYVAYQNCKVQLILNNSKTCCVRIAGDCEICEEIDADDIFVENMRHFITAVEDGQMTRNTTALTEHVRLILAVQRAIEHKKEIERMQISWQSD